MCLPDNSHVALQEIISDKVTEGITLACLFSKIDSKILKFPFKVS